VSSGTRQDGTIKAWGHVPESAAGRVRAVASGREGLIAQKLDAPSVPLEHLHETHRVDHANARFVPR
jgi:hypothetical protein